ncbi:MAG: InlB B-repeat-containing protein [Spirochaetaceae bacterium]|jgi:uncharacterized repeat protein (TIGR02543 family)|nr:InlB B-repeat-containing protein [Spirochaetaceae bacterium]
MPGTDVNLSAEYGEFAGSNDATLSSIIIYSGGSELSQSEIVAEQTEYTVTVPNQAKIIQILAKPNDIQAIPKLDGESELLEDIQLNEGENRFGITVSSSDGSAGKSYALIVKRAPDLSLAELMIRGVENGLYTNYSKSLDVSKTAPHAVTLIEHDVVIIASPVNPLAKLSGDAGTKFYVDGARYQKKTITVSLALDGDEYKQDYIINVCYSDNPDDKGLAHEITLMYNYNDAKNEGVYRKIVVPVVNMNGEGDVLTMQDGLLEADANIERYNYSLEGWYDSASGGVKFDPAEPITMEKTLYAHWRPIEHTLSFNYNYPANDPDSQNEPPTVAIPGDCETPLTPPADPEHPRYTFAGWYTAEGGRYTPSATIAETRTVYAHWLGKSYMVTFYMNTGNNDNTVVSTVEVSYGSSVAPPETPMRAGYAAKGWYTARSGGSKLANGNETIAANSFYVQWIAHNAATIPAAASGGEVEYVSTLYGFDEIHKFTVSGENALTMNSGYFPMTIPGYSPAGKVLIVAGGGGGGGGGGNDNGGGGGGGGVQYGNYVTLTGGSTIKVIVGAGGNGGGAWGNGASGKDSKFGNVTATGGGAGGRGNGTSDGHGISGGSGGGAGAGSGTTTFGGGAPAQTTYTGYTAYGYRGGDSSSGNRGGGGGGAGNNGMSTIPPSGNPSLDAINEIIGVVSGGNGRAFPDIDNIEYAPGGNSGAINGNGSSATIPGGGGQGGGGSGTAGGSGASGIVIVRFPYIYIEN